MEAPPSISTASNAQPPTPFIVAACAAIIRRIESRTGPSPVTSKRIPPWIGKLLTFAARVKFVHVNEVLP